VYKNNTFGFAVYVIWSDENPRAIRPTRYQYRWSINVWAGIIADRVVHIFIN